MSVFLRHSLLLMLAMSGGSLASTPHILPSSVTHAPGVTQGASRGQHTAVTRPSLTAQQSRHFQQSLKALYRIGYNDGHTSHAGGQLAISSQHQPVETLDALMSLAPTAQDELEGLLLVVSQQARVSAMMAPIKTSQRAQQKISDKLQGEARGLTDIVRGSLIANSIPELVASFDALSQRAQLVQIKNRFKNPKPSGYRDINLLLRLPSSDLIVEVQLHLNKISAIKNGPEHDGYQNIQRIERTARAENRALSIQEQNQIAQYRSGSASLYQKAWQGYLSAPLMFLLETPRLHASTS
ncbi:MULTISPECIES: phosphoribosylglycinamide formyltransferase [unclassified Vibrio]|uniref:Phosphoribosylglycinamide formyltransferase n=1 Tax=Vibrio sp. HB236076 TaxID=3232307 RepID=A0AB39HBJ2_9VIBR|nr:phosphoribosylglycinamide formyltransferase [Vibrio sp. HB161653]MDP5253477.1 phosphoribosylglycinamide formyltransferase [Vibrio sp. HB161653]